MDNLYLRSAIMHDIYFYSSSTQLVIEYCYISSLLYMNEAFDSYHRSFDEDIAFADVCKKSGINCCVDNCNIKTSMKAFKLWIKYNYFTRMRIYTG